MNLRLEGQAVRFRIRKEELEALCAGETLEQVTQLPHSLLTLTIRTDHTEIPLRLVTGSQSWLLEVNKTAVQDLLDSLPSREGIYYEQATDGSASLHLMLEVDIRTQKRKRENHGS